MSRTGIEHIDTTTDAGGHAASRLREAPVIWLTTVSGDGAPQTSPVWFLWDGGDFLVYSLESPREDNIVGNPHVGLNLDGNGHGGDIVTIEGIATIDRSLPAVPDNADYLAKYGPTMRSRDWSPEWFGNRYSVPISISPTRFRYW